MTASESLGCPSLSPSVLPTVHTVSCVYVVPGTCVRCCVRMCVRVSLVRVCTWCHVCIHVCTVSHTCGVDHHRLPLTSLPSTAMGQETSRYQDCLRSGPLPRTPRGLRTGTGEAPLPRSGVSVPTMVEGSRVPPVETKPLTGPSGVQLDPY